VREEIGKRLTDILPATADMVLTLLRQLPPRERLRVLVQALPELEQDLPAIPAPMLDFWRPIDVHELAERQGIQPVDDFDALLGGWPEDEPVDDFLVAMREWRRQNLATVEIL